MERQIKDAVQKLLAATCEATTRNSARVEKILDVLDSLVDTSEVRDAIEEYRSIDRSDYSDAEEYSEARTEAWEALCEVSDSFTSDLLEEYAALR